MSEPSFPGRLNAQDPSLSERQHRVFASLLRVHSDTARPVGSELLAAEGAIPLSPASIRAALAELESLGLLERAHASAGRIPSPAGYELWVRQFLTPLALPAAALAEVDQTLLHASRDVEHLLREASRLVAQLTQQMGLAHASSMDVDLLHALDLTPLDARRVMLVLHLGSAALYTLSLELESPLDRAAVAAVESVLRERLTGLPLVEVRDRLSRDPDLVRDSAVRMVARAAAERWADPVSTPLYSAGASHIAGQPEFALAHQLGPVLQAVESGPPLDRLLVGSVEGHAAVRVGLDENAALASCSLVTYVLPGPVRCAVGVLGPMRMNYALALAAVDAVGSRVSELLPS